MMMWFSTNSRRAVLLSCLWCITRLAAADSPPTPDLDAEFDTARQVLQTTTNKQLTIEQAEQQQITSQTAPVELGSSNDVSKLGAQLNASENHELNAMNQPPQLSSFSSTTKPNDYSIGRGTPAYQQGELGSINAAMSLCEKNSRTKSGFEQLLQKYSKQ